MAQSNKIKNLHQSKNVTKNEEEKEDLTPVKRSSTALVTGVAAGLM